MMILITIEGPDGPTYLMTEAILVCGGVTVHSEGQQRLTRYVVSSGASGLVVCRFAKRADAIRFAKSLAKYDPPDASPKSCTNRSAVYRAMCAAWAPVARQAMVELQSDAKESR